MLKLLYYTCIVIPVSLILRYEIVAFEQWTIFPNNYP